MSYSTKKISEEQINRIKQLRANGCSYRQIADTCGVGYGTVQKYAKHVSFLPKSMRRNPFELVSPKIAPSEYEKRIPDPERYVDKAKKEYWIENHKTGTRFEGPLSMFSVTELQEIMEEPTDYHSTMTMREWAIEYLEGPDNFLKFPPYKWGEGQLEIFDLWEKHRKLMIECHRDYGKTMAVDAILTHEICEHKENNYAICSETNRKARSRVKHVGDMFLKNKKIIADYGFLPHQKIYKGTRQAWTKEEITVKREISQTDPTLTCFSSESQSATGAHYDGIVFDDVWSRILDRNPENKEKWLEWFDGELEGCLEDAWELWVLTRKGPTDLYQTMEDKQYYVIYKRPAIVKFPSQYHYEFKEVNGEKVFDRVVVETDDWIISDPTRFTIEYLLEKKWKMNTAEWESEFQLNPMARTGKYWQWKDLRFIDSPEDFYRLIKDPQLRNKSKIIGCMDLAFGTSPRADYTALVIIGFLGDRYYYLDTYIKRGATVNDVVKILAKSRRQFKEMETVYIEADLQQSAWVELIKKKATFVHILPILSRQEQALLDKTNKERKNISLTGKALRIWSQLEALVEDNKLFVNKTMNHFREFKDEFLTFPKCEHFDVLDALGNGLSKMTKKGALIYALHG